VGQDPPGKCQDIFAGNYKEKFRPKSSVADPGALSRIPGPKAATKERGGKKFVVIPFFVATNFT
jgi:hypothetical protein